MYSPLIKPIQYIKSFKRDVRVAIVGSRDYGNKWLVELLVKELPKYVTVVSGYGGIVDKTAVATAKSLLIKYSEHKPDWIYRRRGGGLVRNKMIAQDNLHCLIAFVDTTRSSGTIKTIEYALKEKVKVFLVVSDSLSATPRNRRPRCLVMKGSKKKKGKKISCKIPPISQLL